MTSANADLASLMCSRLCHDMLSPVGAITNGLELLSDEKDPEMRQRCFELLEQSAKITADKLKFFRLAFGAAGGFGAEVPVAEARDLVDALAGNNARITVNWALASETLPKAGVKTLLNFALVAIESLVRGGQLDIGAEVRDGASEIVVRAEGTKLAFDPDIGRALEGSLPESELSGRTAPAAMLHQLASALDGTVQYAVDDNALTMGAVLPAS
jgi:histidine phosphotransferase ChpT